MLRSIVIDVSAKCTVLLCRCITPKENITMKKIRWSAVAAMLTAGTVSAQITETITIDRDYNGGANIAEYNAADTTDPFNGLANVGGHSFQAGTGVGVASVGGANTGLRRVAFLFELPTGIFGEQITDASLRFRLNTYITPTTGLDIYWAPLDTLGTTNQAYALSTFSSAAFTNTGLSLATNAATGTNYTFNVTSLVQQALSLSNATTVVAFRFQMEDDTSLTYGTTNNYNLIGFGGATEANRPALTLEVVPEPSTLGLLGIAAGLLLLMRRRRRI
jgi:hypothetical protein